MQVCVTAQIDFEFHHYFEMMVLSEPVRPGRLRCLIPSWDLILRYDFADVRSCLERCAYIGTNELKASYRKLNEGRGRFCQCAGTLVIM